MPGGHGIGFTSVVLKKTYYQFDYIYLKIKKDNKICKWLNINLIFYPYLI